MLHIKKEVVSKVIFKVILNLFQNLEMSNINLLRDAESSSA